jgi:hypothetical protein
MEALVWRRRRESSPAARKGRAAARGLDARRCFQNASCQRWTLHLRCQAYQNHLDIDHGIYREHFERALGMSAMPPIAAKDDRSRNRRKVPLAALRPHSISSSARLSIDDGTVRPSVLAVPRLITNSNTLGW